MTAATMTTDQIAPLLHCTQQTVQLRARRGDIPALKSGRRWLFDWDEVREHYRNQANPADPWAQSPQSLRARRRN